VSKKPTAKIDRTPEHNFRNNMVQTSRRLLFIHGDSEAEALEKMEWLVAMQVARREHVEWGGINIAALVEDLSVEVKPRA